MFGQPPPSSPATTASRPWPCAQLLADWIAHNKLAGCRVSLALALAWRAWRRLALERPSVCLTDLQENIPPLQQHVNGSGNVSVHALDWRQPLPAAIADQSFDVCLAADCVYWPELFEPLLTTLAQICKSSGTRVLCAAMDRDNRPRTFLEAAREAGWHIVELQWPAPRRPLAPDSLEALRRAQCFLHEMRLGVP